ncbi:MarR family winged helix-turn-helix transcriptional regulator [Methylibium sp.]|uniref:MarR family winged helix-turn-helix transcriptional regulator n=1 Tax=Methylibium sp. TaxID=2067992 RepID=UPI003D0F75B4
MSQPRRSLTPVPADASDLALDSQLCFALYSTSLAMTKVYRPLLARIGLTYPQYVVLLALWECDGLNIGELGERVSLDSGTLTPLLKRMQALGLIERTRSAADERQVLITLTRSGRDLSHAATAIHEQVACATACSNREIQALTQALQDLRLALLAHADG